MLTKEKADQFFAENHDDFEAMTRLFQTAALTGDADYLAYLMVCIEKVSNFTLQAVKAGQNPENISWQ